MNTLNNELDILANMVRECQHHFSLNKREEIIEQMSFIEVNFGENNQLQEAIHYVKKHLDPRLYNKKRKQTEYESYFDELSFE